MKKIGLVLTMLLSLALPVLAQNDAAACGIVGVVLVVYLVIFLVVLAIGITVAVIIFKFIKKDAIARGDNPSKAWFALLGLLGLLIYVLTRPQGNVMPCPSCGKSRMQGLPRCPHCGNA
ncbi:MAG: hypothetical protein ABJA66_20435 [Actinomycetota bacterium]